MTTGTSPEGPHRPKEQLDYHLRTLTEGPDHLRDQAVDAIRDIIRESPARRAEVAVRLNMEFALNPSLTDITRGKVINLAMAMSLDNPEVDITLREIMRDKDPSYSAQLGVMRIVTEGLSAPSQDLAKAILDSIRQGQPAYAVRMCINVRVAINRYASQQVAGIFRQAIEGDVAFQEFLERAERGENLGLQIQARLLREAAGLTSEGSSAEIFEPLKAPKARTQNTEPTNPLVQILLGEISENAVRPLQLISSLVNEGDKRILALGIYEFDFIREGRIEEVLELHASAGITHLALPMPRALREEMNLIARGDSTNLLPRTEVGDAREDFENLDDQQWETKRRQVNELLTALHGKVEVVPIGLAEEGVESDLRGELHNDARLNVIAEILERIPTAKVLVIGQASSMAKGKNDEGSQYKHTFGAALDARFGESHITHVVELNQMALFRFSGEHPLYTALEQIPVKATFGVRTNLATLGTLTWGEDYPDATFSSDWQGMVYRHQGDDDPGFFERRGPAPSEQDIPSLPKLMPLTK
jgi:hypothetical protein